MKFRGPKHGYRLVMIAAPLLALALGGVGRASVCTPGPTAFLEVDGNAGFSSFAGSSFDWANSGANSQSCGYATNPISCTGTNGVFDDSSGCTAPGFAGTVPAACCTGAGTGTCGSFNGSTTPPTPPVPTSAARADTSIISAAFGVDPLSVDVTSCGLGDPTVYTGVGGETNGDPIPSETFGTGSVPNKDEISNVYALAHQNPLNPNIANCLAAGCAPGTCSTACSQNPNCTATNEIYAAFERVVNNGDSHVDLEFLQSAIALVPGSKPAAFPCKGRFQGDRTKGDILLSVDFTKGGKVGFPVIHQWVCGNLAPSPAGVCNPTPGNCSVTTTQPCATNNDCVAPSPCPACTTGETCVRKGGPHYETVASGIVTQSVLQAFNAGGAIGCGGWGCRNANGTQANSINTVEFYEVGVDLAALGFTGCINSFLPHTRSSQSFTSTLKDFELLAFSTCKPQVTVTKDCSAAVNTAGDTVNVSISGQVCNTGNVTLSNISLSNDQPGTKFDATGCLASGFTLAAGACCSYSGSYSESSTCAPSDTVTVTATGSSGSGTVTGSASASCVADCTPRISVTKTCTCDKNTAGTQITVNFNGQVCAKDSSGTNSTLKLTNVIVSDDKGGLTTPAGGNIGTLNPGACANYSGSYTSTAANPCENSDTVTTMATSAITSDPVSSSSTATCSCPQTARISVTKCCFNHLVADSTGRLAEQVDFCGKVCANDGSGTDSDVQLTGVTASNDKGGVTTNPSSTLARGACSSYSGTYFPSDPSTCTATDTVTASGGGICSTSATNTGTATCALCQSTPCSCP